MSSSVDTKEIHFMGLLANVDASILNVNLEHGFEICATSEAEAVALISALERLPPENTLMQLVGGGYLFQKALYYIGNSFKGDIEMNDEGVPIKLPSGLAQFNNDLIHVHLICVIQLLRLFKEGNILMPVKYYYFDDNGTTKWLMKSGILMHGLWPEPYTLESSEIPDLQRFLRDTKLPFKRSYLQLALENFDLSYQITKINLAFLSLMISLEALFNPGDTELTYRISRNAAVLLGEGKEDSKKIFADMKALYKKRSEFVHTGKSSIIKIVDMLKVRDYVRKSIKKVNEIGKNRQELLDMLNSSGFGEGCRMGQSER